MKTLLKWIGTVGLAGFLSACGGGTSYGNLAEVAQKNGFTALLAAVNKAGIAGTLTAPNANLTVFAPTDAAFGTLATQLGFANAGAMVTALSASDLSKILTYHVVAGKLDAKALEAKIKEGKGKAELTTVAGGKLWVMKKDGKIWLKDEKGGMATVTIGDVYQKNGVIHVVDSVVLPK